MVNRALFGPQIKYNSPDAQRQQLLGQQLMKEGIDLSPVKSNWEALARVGTAGIGGYLSGQAGETEKTYQSDRAKALAAALSGSDPTQAANTLLANPSTADLGANLAVGNMTFNRDRAAKKEDTAEERGFRKELFGMERQSRLEDIGLSQNFQREMAQINQAFQSGQMNAQQAFQAAENAKSREQQMQVAQMSRVPAGYQPTETGMQAVPGGPADPAVMAQQAEIKAQVQPLTESQATAATYADRMRASNDIIRRLTEPTEDEMKAGAKPYAPSLMESKAMGTQLGNYLAGTFLPNEKAASMQQFDQAQRDFINAVLRRESGAVISEDEFANARKQYFPQPGDTEEVRAQKKRNREESLAGISRSAGPRYQAKSETKGAIKFLGFE